MGRIPDETIEAIRNRVDVVDVIGRYVSLRQTGRSLKGLCPFHQEKTPSFHVHPERQIFHCFGCNEGGNVFAFLMQAREPELPGGSPGARGRSAASRFPRPAKRRARPDSAGGCATPPPRPSRSTARRSRGRRPPPRAHTSRSAASTRRPCSASASATRPTPGIRSCASSAARHPGRRDRRARRAAGRAQGRRALRSPAGPGHVPDPGRPRRRRSPSADACSCRRRAEVSEHGRDAALPQARGASTDFPRRSRRSAGAAVRSWSRATSTASHSTRAGLAEVARHLRHGAHARARAQAPPPDAQRGAVVRRRRRRASARSSAASTLLLPDGLRVRAAALPPGDDPDRLLAREGAGRTARASSTARRRR